MNSLNEYRENDDVSTCVLFQLRSLSVEDAVAKGSAAEEEDLRVESCTVTCVCVFLCTALVVE